MLCNTKQWPMFSVTEASVKFYNLLMWVFWLLKVLLSNRNVLHVLSKFSMYVNAAYKSMIDSDCYQQVFLT